MSTSSRARCKFFPGAFLGALLLCGCNASDDQPDEASTASGKVEALGGADTAAATVAHRETVTPDETVLDAAAQELARQARISQLTADIGAAQAQQTDLMRKQAEVIARMESHQEQGMAMLTALKADMVKVQALEAQSGQKNATAAATGPRTASTTEQFNAAARTKLENALAQDQALASELKAVNAEMELADSRADAMVAELDTLKSTAHPGDEGKEPDRDYPGREDEAQ